MTAEYKQANQSLSKVLGEGNAKSQVIADGIKQLSSANEDVLNVNYDMLRTLLDIRTGIEKVAAGFSKTLSGSGDYENLGITETNGTSSAAKNLVKGVAAVATAGFSLLITEVIGGQLGAFVDNIIGGIAKGLYNKKRTVIDSGIAITADTLTNIIEGGVLQAQSYADVKTKKKVIGVTTSTKVNRTTEDLDSVFEQQFSDVFRNAGKALKQASTAFGINFDDYVNSLTIKAQDLSLKGLEGDELVKEIESFFGNTLDNWAEVLLGGTNVLEDFQAIGESAFETMLRLATETQTFGQYAKVLELNFKAIGTNAVYATQAIAEAAGGFDVLSSSLATYYDKFFDESEKLAANQAQLTEAFKELGLALPTSREGFREIISGLNLANEADQKRFATLIQLSGASDQYFTALEKETEAKKAAAKQAEDDAKAAKEALKNAAGAAFDALTNAVSKQKDAVQKQIDSANDALNSTRAVADSLNSALKSMTLQSSKNELALRRQAQAQVIAANAIAKAGGPLPKAGQLDDALNILAQPSQDLYASFEDYARDFYTTANNIKELAAATGKQQTIEEQNLEILNSQLTALDDLVAYYQTQIDKLNDVDNSVLSVRNAVLALTDALLDADITPTEQRLPEANYDYETKQYSQNQTMTANTPITSFVTQTELLDKVDTLTEELRASQFAIAKNTLNTAKILQRWDADGMPLETAS